MRLRLTTIAFVFLLSACTHQGGALPASPQIRNLARALSAPNPYIGGTSTIPAIIGDPRYIAYDPDDAHLYVVDNNTPQGQHSILRIDALGATSVFATLPNWGAGIAYDHANRTFYVTTGNAGVGTTFYPGIYSISSAGVVTILAGNGKFSAPFGITVNTSNGALYVADNGGLKKVTTSGVVTTFATVPGASDVAYDAIDKNLYVASGAFINRVTPAGAVSTIAGGCSGSNCGNFQRDGRGSAAFFGNALGLRVDPSTGLIYVADSDNNSIRKVDTSGNVTTFAGNGLLGDIDGIGLDASLAHPIAIEYGNGALYTIDAPSGGYLNTRALRRITLRGAVAPPHPNKITMFDTPTAFALPWSIAWNAHSSYVWFTERGIGKIGRISPSGAITEFTVPGAVSLGSIALGADGTPWFTDDVKIAHMSATGAVTEYSLGTTSYGGSPRELSLGPDGNIWFIRSAGAGMLFGNITPSGVVHTHVLPIYLNGIPLSIAFSSDGNAWIADGTRGVKVSQSGAMLQNYQYAFGWLTAGPGSKMWFTQSNSSTFLSAVGSIAPTTNIVHIFAVTSPPPGCFPNLTCTHSFSDITSGPDGALWMSEYGGYSYSAIDRIATNGVFTDYVIPAARAQAYGVSAGPDGNVWFVDEGAQKIGRVNLH